MLEEEVDAGEKAVDLVARLGQGLADLVRQRLRQHLELARDLDIIIGLFNDAWSQNWGFVPFTGDEIKDLLLGKKPTRESVIEPQTPRSSAVPPAGKSRPRPEGTGPMEPQPQS